MNTMNTNEHIQEARKNFFDDEDRITQEAIDPELSMQDNLINIVAALKNHWENLVDKEWIIKAVRHNQVNTDILQSINDSWDIILKSILTRSFSKKVNSLVSKTNPYYLRDTERFPDGTIIQQSLHSVKIPNKIKGLFIQERFENGKPVGISLLTVRKGLLELKSTQEEKANDTVWELNNELLAQYIKDNCRNIWPRGAVSKKLASDIRKMVSDNSLAEWDVSQVLRLVDTIFFNVHPDIVRDSSDEGLDRISHYLDQKPEYLVFGIRTPEGYSKVFGDNIKQSIKGKQVEITNWGVIVHQEPYRNLQFRFGNKVVFWTARGE